MLGAMTVLQDVLAGHRVVVAWPSGEIEDWIALAEVLVQEGLKVWAWPADRLDRLGEVTALYGRRVRIGIAGSLDDGQLWRAARAGAQFWLSPTAVDPERAVPLPYLAGALTPNEVAQAARSRDAAVLVAPADALGTSYARTLPTIVPGVSVVPWGRLERYQCDMWLEAGAGAVVVQDVVVRPEGAGGKNLVDEVGQRAGLFGQLAATGDQ